VVFGQVEPDVAAYANTYFLIVEASTPFLAIYSAGGGSVPGHGQLRHLHWVSLIMKPSMWRVTQS
jgi:Na+-driven multidrug efflux pump